MQNKVEKGLLFILCIYSLFFFIGSTLSPMMAHFQSYDVSAKLTSLYMYSCHQQPDRSLWLLGYPIALCCRCYGFYLGVSTSTILALFNKLKVDLTLITILFITSLVDISANVILKINTGNITRFFIGIMMGFLCISLLLYIIKFIKEKLNNEY